MTAGIARFAVALAGALTFSACLLGVDPEPKADPETVAKRDDALSATVGGFGWSVKVNDTWFNVVDIATISIGGRNTSTYLAIRLTGVDRLGPIPIGGFTPPFASVELRQNGIIYSTAQSPRVGTLTITELTANRISGTFALTAPRITASTPGGMANELPSMPVTNGTFSLAVLPAYSVPIAR